MIAPPMIRRKPSAMNGLTLIELMICLAVLAILVSQAVPWFGKELAQHRLNSQAQLLRHDLMLARVEALRQQRDLVFCPLPTQAEEQPSCSAFNGTGAGHWPNGYLLFVRQPQARANHWPDYQQGDRLVLVRSFAAGVDMRFNQGHRLRVRPKSTVINGSFRLTSHLSGVKGWRLVLIGTGRPRMEIIDASG